MKPVKAWAVVTKRGEIRQDYESDFLKIITESEKELAEIIADGGERVIPVLITPIEEDK